MAILVKNIQNTPYAYAGALLENVRPIVRPGDLTLDHDLDHALDLDYALDHRLELG